MEDFQTILRNVKRRFKSGDSGYKPVKSSSKAVTGAATSGDKRLQTVTNGYSNRVCNRLRIRNIKVVTAVTAFALSIIPNLLRSTFKELYRGPANFFNHCKFMQSSARRFHDFMFFLLKIEEDLF
jgi:hypothetical protein